MPKHKDLFGVQLHNSKVAIDYPDRAPSVIGEMIFDGATLWVATGDTLLDWERSSNPPPVFSWVLNTAVFDPQLAGFVAGISLYYYNCTAVDAYLYADSFALLRRWIFNEEWKTGAAIDITQYIQVGGKGCYVFALDGLDAYGAVAANPCGLSVAFSQPNDLSLFVLTAPFIGWEARTYSNAHAFEVLNPFAQVILNPVNISG